MINKLHIRKNPKSGRYYAIIQNMLDNSSMIMMVNFPKGTIFEENDLICKCDYYISCFKSKTNSQNVPVINITKIYRDFVPNVNPYEGYEDSETPTLYK